MKEIKLEKTNEVIYYEVSDIGLPVYLWVNDKVSNFYATLNVKYGSIDTEFKIGTNKKYLRVPNGIAHFLEHVKFNMGPNKSAFDEFTNLGSDTNAFTTFDYTCYMVYASSKFKENLETLLKFVMNLYLTDDIVTKEKGIICEEVKMGEDDPNSSFYFATNKAIYKHDKRQYEIAGTTKDVESITKKDLELIFNSFYRPDNMFLIITGNFNPYEAMAIINETTKNFTFADTKVTKKKIKEDDKIATANKVIKNNNVEVPKVNIVYKMKRSLFKDYKDEELKSYLTLILASNFGTTTYFKEELLENDLIVYLSYSVDVSADLVILTIRLVSKYPKEVTKLIKEKMTNLELNEDLLKTMVKSSWATYIWDFDDIEVVNNNLQAEILSYKDIISKRYSLLKKINLNDANLILKSLNLNNNATITLEKEDN